MQDPGFALLLIGYVWSMASSGRRSIPYALLCLPLFPLAQLAFAINDAPMHPPLALAAFGTGLTYLSGDSVFGRARHLTRIRLKITIIKNMLLPF